MTSTNESLDTALAVRTAARERSRQGLAAAVAAEEQLADQLAGLRQHRQDAQQQIRRLLAGGPVGLDELATARSCAGMLRSECDRLHARWIAATAETQERGEHLQEAERAVRLLERLQAAQASAARRDRSRGEQLRVQELSVRGLPRFAAEASRDGPSSHAPGRGPLAAISEIRPARRCC